MRRDRPAGQISYWTRFGFKDAPHDASAGAREPFFGTPAEIVADLEACAAAGVDELKIEPGAPRVESAAEWSALFDRFTADVLPHGLRCPGRADTPRTPRETGPVSNVAGETGKEFPS